MAYGGITFEHAWAFQIKCMMANQFGTLVDALESNDKSKIIVACLRLGWNDAFRHVSENNSDAEIIKSCARVYPSVEFSSSEKLKDSEREGVIIKICESLVPHFEEYAKEKDTASRLTYLDHMMSKGLFTTNRVGIYKKEFSKKNPLCVGHIQKMFNIATKLLLCLILTAEHASRSGEDPILCARSDGRMIHICEHDLLSYGNFPYSFENADCPVDNIILTEVEKKRVTPPPSSRKHYNDIPWSKIGSHKKSNPISDYQAIQDEIARIQGAGKCNLLFDFENWNS